VGQDLVGIEDAIGIKNLFDLVHQLNNRLGLGISAQQEHASGQQLCSTGGPCPELCCGQHYDWNCRFFLAFLVLTTASDARSTEDAPDAIGLHLP
jgi:hypothetical protein